MSDYRYEKRGRRYFQRGVVTDPLEPHSQCPNRSPKAVSDAIKDIIEDKVVCELGCAEGDNMMFMSRYAKKVIGFEYNPDRGRVAEQRGLSVTYGDYFKDQLPEADVYYFWPNDGCEDNDFLVGKISETCIVGADTGCREEPPCLMDLVSKYSGRLIEVEFNEGDWKRASGTFLLGIFHE